MVYGGSSITTNPEGTPQAGGVSGGTGDVSVFAPIGKSNVVLLGDAAAGSSLSPEQEFVVNVTAQPGAYPLKLSFVYTDAKGNRVIDDRSSPCWCSRCLTRDFILTRWRACLRQSDGQSPIR